MKVLHFMCHGNFNVRCQRAIQSNINMGLKPYLLVNRNSRFDGWIPDYHAEVTAEFYDFNRRWGFCVPIWRDYLGLKKVFNRFKCDVVHAHELWTAWYSWVLGLPTVFDDWEFFLEYMPLTKWGRNPLGWFGQFVKKLRGKGMTKKLIQEVPTVVTNRNVKVKYEELGASCVTVVPNVPLKLEREYALSKPIPKGQIFQTCYIGDLSKEDWALRDAAGVRELWSQHRLGVLYEFSGRRYVHHLDLLVALTGMDLNLLFWKPHPIHRYYVQNKAFLASAVGLPTLISSSLTATIDLLGDFAIPVDDLLDIPGHVWLHHDLLKKRNLEPAEHLFWEHYQDGLAKMYEEV